MILEKIVLMGAGMEAGVGSQILVSTELLFRDEVHLSTRGSKNKKRGKEKKEKTFFCWKDSESEHKGFYLQ